MTDGKNKQSKMISKLPLPNPPKLSASRRGRSSRRAIEDVPSADYLEVLAALGPREGESILSFRMRFAGVAEGREFVLEAADVHDCDTTKLCEALGIKRGNLRKQLLGVGLNTTLMRSLVRLRRT